VRAVAADASGNLFAVGSFTGSLTFGSTQLTSRGIDDLFVAKYVPGSSTWAWAISGGGTGSDQALGVAVVGSIVYVTGYLTTDAANANTVALATGGSTPSLMPVAGASTTASADVVLAKYTDQGSTATLGWVQVGGGTGDDKGQAVAASGSSVYVTGSLTNTLSNVARGVFGGNGTVAGTAQVNGASSNLDLDLLLLKYADQGSTGSFVWSQVGGGTSGDYGRGVAVSGSSLYVTGGLTNNITNNFNVVLGGGGTTHGTVRQNGVGPTNTASSDIALLKYTDQGSSGSFVWSQVGGGNQADFGRSVAVQGSSIYVAGKLNNSSSNANGVLFGGSGTTAGTRPQYGASSRSSDDLLLAKYTDQGSSATLGWTQVAGGTFPDEATGVAVSGSSVYVTGYLTNNTSNGNGVLFGGSGTTAGTVVVNGLGSTLYNDDLLLARYTDNGPTGSLQWAQLGGGYNSDQGIGVVLSGSSVWAGGYASPDGSFGRFPVSGAPTSYAAVLARVADPVLPVRAATPGAGSVALYPNPTAGLAALRGALPGQLVQVVDMLGREVALTSADATGTARLSGLVTGIYWVRVGGGSVRLVVE
jgi:hypothetical protein